MSRKINPLSRSRRVKDTDPVADGERQLLINAVTGQVVQAVLALISRWAKTPPCEDLQLIQSTRPPTNSSGRGRITCFCRCSGRRNRSFTFKGLRASARMGFL